MKIKFTAIIILTGCMALPMFGQSTPTSSGQGMNLKVDCSRKSEESFPTISAALKKLNPTGPNTVTVSGTCNENLLIQGFDRLTLISSTNAKINDASGGSNPVVFILDSRSITLQGFTISGGNVGVFCDTASVCYLTGNTVVGALGQEGVGVADGSTAFLSSNVIQHNGQRGLTVGGGSRGYSDMDNFDSNGDVGVFAISGAYFNVTNSSFQNNGSDGVVVSDHSAIRLGSCTISGNAGNGVRLQSGSEARFDASPGASTVTANGGSGVFVGSLSFAFFGEGGNITGNLGGTDVECGGQFSATAGALINIGGGKTNCVN
jgi:Right handed beta helix region